VKLEEFIAALRRIGHNELADKIESMILLFMTTVYVWVFYIFNLCLLCLKLVNKTAFAAVIYYAYYVESLLSV